MYEVYWIGIGPDLYWTLTLTQLRGFVNAYNTQHINQLKEQASMQYRNSLCLTTMINKSLVGKNDFPDITDIYDNLWTEEDKQEIEEIRIGEQLKQFAAQYNSQLKDGD